MVRRAPPGDDRQDLDELVPTGEAVGRLLTSIARVAVDGNRECIAHVPSVRARDLVGRSALRDCCSHGDATPIRLVEGFSGLVRADLPWLVAMSQRSV